MEIEKRARHFFRRFVIVRPWKIIFRGRYYLFLLCFRFPHHLSATTEPSSGPSTASTSSGATGGRYNKGGLNLKSYNFCTIKVVQAKTRKAANGKIEFDVMDSIHINLTTSTANVTSINKQVQMKWGIGYMIVSNDGLPIGDSPATRGMYLRIG